MIELAGQHRLRLVCLNLNLYLEKEYLHLDPNYGPIKKTDFRASERKINLGDHQWEWFNKVMKDARRKKQNVSFFLDFKENFTMCAKSIFMALILK